MHAVGTFLAWHQAKVGDATSLPSIRQPHLDRASFVLAVCPGLMRTAFTCPPPPASTGRRMFGGPRAVAVASPQRPQRCAKHRGRAPWSVWQNGHSIVGWGNKMKKNLSMAGGCSEARAPAENRRRGNHFGVAAGAPKGRCDLDHGGLWRRAPGDCCCRPWRFIASTARLASSGRAGTKSTSGWTCNIRAMSRRLARIAASACRRMAMHEVRCLPVGHPCAHLRGGRG